MQATNKAEATRIAIFGARKMDAQGYTLSASGVEHHYNVTRADDFTYGVRVNHPELPDLCGCGFYRENAAYKVCKHTMRVRWWLKDLAAEAARNAEEDSFGIIIRPTTQMEIGEADMEEARIRIGQWYGGEYHN